MGFGIKLIVICETHTVVLNTAQKVWQKVVTLQSTVKNALGHSLCQNDPTKYQKAFWSSQPAPAV